MNFNKYKVPQECIGKLKTICCKQEIINLIILNLKSKMFTKDQQLQKRKHKRKKLVKRKNKKFLRLLVISLDIPKNREIERNFDS